MHHVGFTRVEPEPVIETLLFQLINFRPVDSPPAKKALAVGGRWPGLGARHCMKMYRARPRPRRRTVIYTSVTFS